MRGMTVKQESCARARNVLGSQNHDSELEICWARKPNSELEMFWVPSHDSELEMFWALKPKSELEIFWVPKSRFRTRNVSGLYVDPPEGPAR